MPQEEEEREARSSSVSHSIGVCLYYCTYMYYCTVAIGTVFTSSTGIGMFFCSPICRKIKSTGHYFFVLSFSTNLKHALSCGSLNDLLERMHSHTHYICLAFHHCEFSNVSSSFAHEGLHNHTGCICLTFLHCEFSNVSSTCLPERMHTHIGCICLPFLHCAFGNACSNGLP